MILPLVLNGPRNMLNLLNKVLKLLQFHQDHNQGSWNVCYWFKFSRQTWPVDKWCILAIHLHPVWSLPKHWWEKLLTCQLQSTFKKSWKIKNKLPPLGTSSKKYKVLVNPNIASKTLPVSLKLVLIGGFLFHDFKFVNTRLKEVTWLVRITLKYIFLSVLVGL